jgi:hypothetical protein
MSATIQLASGEKMELRLGGLLVKERPASFELVMCERDRFGRRTNVKRRAYRGDHAPAVEATFLKALSEVEKVEDVYAVPAGV